jgi:serine/threonine protein kinase
MVDMPADEPWFPGLSVSDSSPASWLEVADRAAEDDEGSWDAQRSRSEAPGESTAHLPAIYELVKADLVRKWRSGNPVRLESYLEALPDLGTRDTLPAALIMAEYEERRRCGELVEIGEYTARFPCQAETLRHWIGRSRADTSAFLESDFTGQVTPLGRPPTAMGPQPAAPVRLPKQFGRYRILKRLGQGGMGTVYLAYDPQLDRRVALKVPHIAPGSGTGDANRQDLDRFYREIRAAATLQHPNLCPVYDQGQIDGIYYVTMAYLKGRPLSALIDHQQLLSPRWVAAAVRTLALALAEAHGSGVIHRDLKPSNIMVVARRHLMIMDFGLAWRVGTEDARLTKHGTILGTPAYMSPEQLSGNLAAIGPRCDIYSLGVILYELLTARRPFEGPTTAVMAQVLFKDPKPPSVHRPELDGALEAICLQAMAKKPEDRPRTMAELAKALGRYLRSHPGSIECPPDPASARAPCDAVAESAVARATPPSAPEAAPLLIGTGDPALPDDQPGVFEAGAGGPPDPMTADPVAPQATPGDDRTGREGPGDSHPEPPRPRPAAVGPAPHEPPEHGGTQDPDSQLKVCWRAWTAVVEQFALRRSGRWITPEAYEKLYGDLIRACYARVESCDEVRRPLYERLIGLAQPCLTQNVLLKFDREVRFDLLIRCRQADLELHGMTQAAENLRTQILAARQSADRPMRLAERLGFAVALALGLLVLVAMLILSFR